VPDARRAHAGFVPGNRHDAVKSHAADAPLAFTRADLPGDYFVRRTLVRISFALTSIASGFAISAAAGPSPVTLPNGWILDPPAGAYVETATMPQGMAASPDGATIAVVESGYSPPTLGLYRVPDLTKVASIPLPGAFGRPLWIDADHVLVAGANSDALLDVDVRSQRLERIALPKASYPVLVAANGDALAVATDGDGAVRIGTLATIGTARGISVGAHPGGLAFAADGKSVFATSRATSELVKIDVASGTIRRQATALHPSGLALGGQRVYVAQSDADSVGIYDAGDLHRRANIFVGDDSSRPREVGVSPNAVTVTGDTEFISLGAANSVAVVRNDRLAGRVQAGWYPTDALAIGNTLYVLDGKGEGARPNPNYRMRSHDDRDYIGSIEFGSLRAYAMPPAGTVPMGSPQGSKGWANAPPPNSVVRRSGPIAHVFFVLKENRSYDQVLGDVSAGNGDPSLAWFGRSVTPNEHAIAARFGLFDNAYASGEVSAAGHMWADAAFANDYVERFWPPSYGGRREVDDLSVGSGPRVPANGFVWDSARRANVSFRDYGESVDPEALRPGHWIADVPSLNDRIDDSYAGWDLDYSDLDRVKEWRRDFAQRVAAGTVPQLEFIWLPNDHTYGSKAGKLAPASYVALNDYALGQMVDTLSHSKIWKSSAMFVIEDDAQDGPDHVSDQRTTMFVISPYARGGARHEHYATVGILRTIEIMLGMQPLSTYDAMAVPLYGAFGLRADARPYAVIPPKIDVTRRNSKVAYRASVSARLDFSRPDAVAGGVLEDILAHNHR
jgi:DNA-binding beta-propeller fold protein YncE